MSVLHCETCDVDLHGKGVYFDAGTTRCSGCQSVIGGRERRSRRRRASDANAAETGIALPPHIRVHADQTSLTIRVPWRLQHAAALSWMIWVSLLGTIAVVFTQLEMTTRLTVAVTGITALVLYVIQAVNHTLITVTGTTIHIRHTPIPWLSRSIDSRNIAQLYVERRPLAQKTYDYHVRAKLHDGDKMLFLRSLSDAGVALYLEQRIESRLHIVDHAVTGAFRPEQLAPPSAGS